MDSIELSLVTGERYSVRGTLEEVEAAIIAASRGSIMQLAWLTDQEGEKIGVNPSAVVSLRVAH
ncbi:MAG TPA: hypothetical protein VG294_19105 [Solirubrobacteraceae bacterium]|nr:hypothetical protein [Solirubrobacteraceae bacterium]